MLELLKFKEVFDLQIQAFQLFSVINDEEEMLVSVRLVPSEPADGFP
jgi:hypothetical protein